MFHEEAPFIEMVKGKKASALLRSSVIAITYSQVSYRSEILK